MLFHYEGRQYLEIKIKKEILKTMLGSAIIIGINSFETNKEKTHT